VFSLTALARAWPPSVGRRRRALAAALRGWVSRHQPTLLFPLLEKPIQHVAGSLDRRRRVGIAVHRCSPVASGILWNTAVPWPGDDSISSTPPANTARSCIPGKPNPPASRSRALLTQVRENLDEAAWAYVAEPKRGRHAARPEPGAVLADHPILVDSAPVCFGFAAC